MRQRRPRAHAAGEPPPESVAPDADDMPEADADETPAPDEPAEPPHGVPEELMPAEGRPVTPTVVPRWVQLVVLPIALLAVWALARAAGPVVLITTFAGVVALIVNPLVTLLQRMHIRRGLAIACVYVGFLACLGGIGVLLSDPVSTQVSNFQRDVPRFVHQANDNLASFQRWLDRNGIKVHVQQQGQTALQTLQKSLLKRSGAIVSFTRDLLTQLVSFGFDLVLVIVLSIYMLLYGKQIGRLLRRVVPPGDGTPEDDFPTLIQRAVSGYVRGQLLFSFIMGASAAVALWIFGVTGIFPDGERYAVFFGAFYGLMEMIPYIGPIIGPIPAILVALFYSPITAVWVVLMFIALQQLEGHVVAPQVFRLSLRINPILIILALLIGYQLYGIAGALVALPVAAMVRETILYLRRHLVLEPWNVAMPGAAVARLGDDVCADCGHPIGAGDGYCRSCGASLEPRVRAPR